MGSALRTWLIVAATILWVMVSRGRALVARLPWVLAAPALTIIALVLFSIYGAYGGYQALHPKAKTPPDVVAAGIGLGPHARVAARHSLAQHRPEAPRMTLKQDLQTKAVVAVNEYRPGGMLPTGHVNISFFFHGTAQGTFGRMLRVTISKAASTPWTSSMAREGYFLNPQQEPSPIM